MHNEVMIIIRNGELEVIGFQQLQFLRNYWHSVDNSTIGIVSLINSSLQKLFLRVLIEAIQVHLNHFEVNLAEHLASQKLSSSFWGWSFIRKSSQRKLRMNFLIISETQFVWLNNLKNFSQPSKTFPKTRNSISTFHMISFFCS